jgi:hypothetical protein
MLAGAPPKSILLPHLYVHIYTFIITSILVFKRINIHLSDKDIGTQFDIPNKLSLQLTSRNPRSPPSPLPPFMLTFHLCDQHPFVFIKLKDLDSRVVFCFCQFCVVGRSQSGNDPHESLAKFCYKINLKVEPSIFCQIFTLLQKQLSYNCLKQNHQSSHAHWMCFDMMTWQPTWQSGLY